MNRMTYYAIVLICLVTPSLRLAAQKAAAAVPAEGKITILVYDIRDICSVVAGPSPESTLIPATQIGAKHAGAEATGRGGGGGGFGPAGGPGSSRQAQALERVQVVSDITNIIKESVDRESWIDNGGSAGSLKYFNGMLVVSQTATNQAKIGELLKQIRAESAKMVRIRATWVPLSPAELALVLVKDKAGKAASALQEVDPAALEDLVKNRQPARGQITCFNGQSVAMSSGRAHSIITDVEAVAGQGCLGYNPTMQTVRDGADLRLTPTISPEGDLVTVHLASVYSEWPAAVAKAASSTTRPVTDEPNATVAAVAGLAMIDRIDMLVQDFRTTVRIPAGRMVLISGMTLAPAAAETRTEQMFLILEATPIK